MRAGAEKISRFAKGINAKPTAGRYISACFSSFALVAAEAEKGKVQAMLQLGGFYEQGVGVGRNYSKAFEWYQKAASAGRPEGYYNLGVCYEIGMGAAGDMAKSVQNYQKAAEMGLTQAMQKLASIYITGASVPRNTDLGMAWLEQAASAGNSQAMNELGVIYLSGPLERKKDEKKALACSCGRRTWATWNP